MSKEWSKVKKSGAYHRRQKKEREEFEQKCILIKNRILSSARVGDITRQVPVTASASSPSPSSHNLLLVPQSLPTTNIPVGSVDIDHQRNCYNGLQFVDYIAEHDNIPGESENSNDDAEENENGSAELHCDDEYEEQSKERNLKQNLKKWALEFQINHAALRGLLSIINTYAGDNVLPQDGRTLLHSENKVIQMKTLDGGTGEYWHNGLKRCLSNTFRNLHEPISISINVNVDGLPLYNSSKVNLWPILCTITEMPKIRPMVIGIYCGSAKITDLNSYFSPFVDELQPILSDGLIVNSNKITVRFRCFICDSPARAFVKGNYTHYLNNGISFYFVLNH